MTQNTMNLNHQRTIGTIIVIILLLFFAFSVLVKNILILDYCHVLLGAMWTGSDVFLGLIFFIVLSGMNDKIKSNISMRIIPMTLYFIPTISVITPLSGFILSLQDNIFSITPLFIIILIIAFILAILSLGLILPFSFTIYGEFKKVDNNEKLIAKKLMGIIKVALVQVIFQIGIISLMAYIVVFM